jgi:hypothetical protein
MPGRVDFWTLATCSHIAPAILLATEITMRVALQSFSAPLTIAATLLIMLRKNRGFDIFFIIHKSLAFENSYHIR